MDLTKIRDEIDKVDTILVDTFEKRMYIVQKVAMYKIANNMKVLDPAREEKVIQRAENKVGTDYLKPYVKQFFKNTMTISRQMQNNLIAQNAEKPRINSTISDKDVKIGYLGNQGSFSHQAMLDYYDKGEAIEFANFPDILNALSNEKLTSAIVPIENTSTGGVNQVMDLLYECDVFIMDEYILKVEHNLLGIKGARLEDIKNVISHPQAIEQCKKYLQDNDISYIPTSSTAKGALDVSEGQDKTMGTIASKLAADIYDLDVIEKNIHTNSSNYTRFIILCKKQLVLEGANKISLVTTLEHISGALHTLITIFAAHNINLMKIISRPIANTPWHYRFHLDIEGSLEDEGVQLALYQAKDFCIDIKILGNYPQHVIPYEI